MQTFTASEGARSRRGIVAALVLVAATLSVAGAVAGSRSGATDAAPATWSPPALDAAPGSDEPYDPAAVLGDVERTLRPGDEGPDVVAVQERLLELRYDPGPADGDYGLETLYAVWAFQKVHGFRPDGIIDRDLWRLMVHALPPEPVVPDGPGDRVEVELERQLLFLWEDGVLALISHVSTGSEERFCANGRCRFAVTPKGDFAFTWRHAGWRTSELGELYNPVYFNGGIAVHGSPSVPTEPASHGCVRLPMHIAEYFPSLVERGRPILVR